MIKVKNGNVRISGSRRETAYELGRLLTHLLMDSVMKSERISMLLALAERECEIIGPEFCIGEPVFEEDEINV